MSQDVQQNEQQFMTSSEVCEMFAISKTTLWRWQGKGVIKKPIRIGGRLRWLASDIKGMVDGNV